MVLIIALVILFVLFIILAYKMGRILDENTDIYEKAHKESEEQRRIERGGF